MAKYIKAAIRKYVFIDQSWMFLLLQFVQPGHQFHLRSPCGGPWALVFNGGVPRQKGTEHYWRIDLGVGNMHP
jgi:hypothetical protein